MKTIRPKGLLESLTFYGMILINILILFLPIPGFFYKLLAFIIGNAMFYNGGINDHYLFEYDSEKLIVRNTWNPFFYQGYFIKHLSKIELDYFNGAGHGVVIYFEAKREVYVCACDKTVLNEFVDNVRILIKKSKSQQTHARG